MYLYRVRLFMRLLKVTLTYLIVVHCTSLETTAQGLNVSFIIPHENSVCVNENLKLINTSLNAIQYEWDFCVGDLVNSPSSTLVNQIGSNGDFWVLKQIMNDNGKWFGFAVSKAGNKLFRLSYNNGLNSAPGIEDLGNISGKLNNVSGLEIFKEANKWYGLAHNGGTSFASSAGELLRLNFETDLSSEITAEHIIGGIGGQFSSLDVGRDGDSLVVIMNNYFGQNFHLVNFGASVTNNPDASSVKTTPVISSVDFVDVTLAQHCGKWYGFALGWDAKSLYRLDFSNGSKDLFSVPVVTSLGNIFTVRPARVQYVEEGGEFLIFVSSEAGNIFRIKLNNSITGSISTVEDLGTFGVFNKTFGLSLGSAQGRWYINALNSTGSLYKLTFPETCSAVNPKSFELNPFVQYTSSGAYKISLTGTSINGCKEELIKTITITNNASPNPEFTLDSGRCAGTTNHFSVVDTTSVLSYSWDFGDGTSLAAGQNVSHQYMDTGNYEVQLSIAAANGCANTAIKNISIYNPPQSGFNYDAGVICSNSPMSFTNNTIFAGPDSLLSFQWNFNNEASINQKNPSYTFTTGGDKNITLAASIPGCVSESSKVVNIGDGPIVGFNFFGTCQYEDFSFVNSTIGADITGYQWDFGDGYFSTLTSPKHKYAVGGDYAINLTASNAIGCNTTIQKIVQVRHIPKLNFTNDLACSDNTVTLFDKSTVQDANISSWFWRLENQEINYNKTRTGPSPSFLLSGHGEYTATLIGQSNYGCTDTLSRIITVNQSPKVDFIIPNTCYGDSTNFRAQVQLPAGTTLENTEWIIENKSYTTEEVKYRFSNPGSYPVTLYARASNLCPGDTLKSIRINPLPSVDFQLSSQCEEQDVLFTSLVSSPADPVSSYLWTIDKKNVSNKPEFTYQFKKDGNSDIKLQVLSANNCINSLQKTLPIYPKPVSKFSANPSIGPTPLLVQFTDRSQGANQVRYDFSASNDDFSTDRNPTYTYSPLGKDIVYQFISNNFGCNDTSSQDIDVIVPLFDLAIESVKAKISNSNIQFVILLRNDGNIIINNPELSIDISGLVKMRQRVECALAPGGTYEYFTDFQIINNGSTIEYSCFSTGMTYGIYNDADATDNSQCVNLENSFTVKDPYPNPSKTQTGVDIILPEIDDITLRMVDERGAILLDKEYENMPSGLNTITVDLAPYQQGLYMLLLKNKNSTVTKKLVIL